MLGALGGVTVVASLLAVRRYPRFVPTAWTIYTATAIAASFEVPA